MAHLPGVCAPGTDGVASVIGRVRLLEELPDSKPWMWSVTDPDLAGVPGHTHGEVPSRRQATDCLIERWHELRRLR